MEAYDWKMGIVDSLMLLLQFDAIDNGVSQYPANLQPKYRDGTGISSRVGKLNPWWNEEGVDYMERFLKAGKDTTTSHTIARSSSHASLNSGNDRNRVRPTRSIHRQIVVTCP